MLHLGTGVHYAMLRWGRRHMHHCKHFFVLETIESLCTNFYHHLLSLPAHPAQALLASARSSFSPISSACSTCYILLIQLHLLCLLLQPPHSAPFLVQLFSTSSTPIAVQHQTYNSNKKGSFPQRLLCPGLSIPPTVNEELKELASLT